MNSKSSQWKIAPTASILGGPDFYVQKGSTINLTCTIRLAPDESPAFIFWYHEDEVKTYSFKIITRNSRNGKTEQDENWNFSFLSLFHFYYCSYFYSMSALHHHQMYMQIQYLGDKLWQPRRNLDWDTKGWFNNIASPHTECWWDKFGQI